MFCLVRTGGGEPPQQGISFLCFDMDLRGINVRPIISLAGDHELNQVFFDDVEVPASALVGDEGAGWRIAKYLLEHERGHAWAPLLRARMKRMHAAAAVAFGAPGPGNIAWLDLRGKLAAAECALDALEALELRALASQTRGEPPGMAPSIGKVLGTELRQRMTALAVEIGGHYAHARPEMAPWMENDHALLEHAITGMSSYLNDRAASIYAGTNEVQRNIIAAAMLGN
jgi:acyl-CoA dehydrogenase